MLRILARAAAVRLALIAVTTACLWMGTARAQSEDPDILYRRVTELYQAGKYAEAMPLSERYAAAMKSRHGDEAPQYAVALTWLAALYRAQGRYAEAEPLYQRALAIDEKALGSNHPDVGLDLNLLAQLYRDQRRYSEAEPLFKRALAIHEKASGPDHKDVAADLNNLALLYRDQGRYAEAEPLLYKRALAISGAPFGARWGGWSRAVDAMSAAARQKRSFVH